MCNYMWIGNAKVKSVHFSREKTYALIPYFLFDVEHRESAIRRGNFFFRLKQGRSEVARGNPRKEK